jgi:hypothetical protein
LPSAGSDPSSPVEQRGGISFASWRALTLALWGITFVTVMAFFFAHAIPYNPYGDVYADAASSWRWRVPLYDLASNEGFQYFPQAALVAAPFAALGDALGNLSWRLAGWCAYAPGVFRLARMLAPVDGSDRREAFVFFASLGAAFPALSSLGVGQSNLAMTALMLHAVADLHERRWNRAVAWLLLGLAIKPLMAVLVLLVWSRHPGTWWRILIGIAILVALPFLFASPEYVVEQYRACALKLGISAQTGNIFFEDLGGMLTRIGLPLAPRSLTALRLLAAAALAIVGWLDRARGSSAHAGVLLLALAAGYLVLMNPRTQSNSYVIVAAPVALFAALAWFEDRRATALVYGVVLLAWCTYPAASRRLEHVLKPLGAVVAMGLLARERCRSWGGGGGLS